MSPLAFPLILILMQVPAAPEPQRLQDPPSAGSIPFNLDSARLEPALRVQIENALKARHYAMVETLLVSEIEKNPGSPELLKLLGGVFFLDGKYLNCAVAMKRAEALAPLDDRDHFTLAMAYVLLKRSDWARAELEKLVMSEPKNPLYPYWIARLDYDAAQYNSAIAGFQKTLRSDPGFVRAHDNLGLCYEALGRFSEAMESYGEAVRLNRDALRGSPWPALNFGILLTKMGNLEGAEASLREAVHLDAKLAQVHYQLGVLLEKRQRMQEAIEELNQAATLDPSYAEPHYALGRIYRKMGDREKAEKALAAFQKLKISKQ